MKLLVTGGSGFLGSRVARYFSGAFEVWAPSHSQMDITDENQVFAGVNHFQPDVIIHCAAMADVGQCRQEPEISWQKNVVGSVNMARAAGKVGAKCLLCSSDQVYYATASNIYAKEKLAAEAQGLAENPDCVFLRLSWMYDPTLRDLSRHRDFFTNLLPKLDTGEELSYAVYDRRGITDVNEVIRNMEKAIGLPGGVYDFGAPNQKNMYETVVSIFSGLGLDTGRIQKNTEAFRDQPRDMTMEQETVNGFGIFFGDTVETLVHHFSERKSHSIK